ncbi:MAG: hypothetical protein ACP5KA_06990 [Desulfurococcaceae archaeon]
MLLRCKNTAVCLEVVVEDPEGLYESLSSDFSRRYLPPLEASGECRSVGARVYWLSGSGFEVLASAYSDYSPDTYVVAGEYPEAYVNEAPVFFMLQVLARALAREGYVLVTDSVAVDLGGRAVLFLGFPHTGKSTISAIAADRGYRVLSTENTIVKPSASGLLVYGGTRVLVFDPRIRELYGVRLESTKKTKHGYEVVDLDALHEPLEEPLLVSEIYLLYTSFSSYGVSVVPIRGRKAGKLAWHFAVSLLKGLDYYEPAPLDMPLAGPVRASVEGFVKAVVEGYSGRFYEVFGSPLEVFNYVARQGPPGTS